MPGFYLQLRDIHKRFSSPAGEFEALKGINLTFNEGEFTGIVGRSGSGKSTLLNLIAGIDHPSLGEVSVENRVLTGMNESELSTWRGRNVGIVFQFFQLMPTLTIRENLLLAMDFVNKIPVKERHDRAMDLLGAVDISQLANKRPKQLSGGEQQRAAIARALVNDPNIVIADEPTGNLDSETSASIISLFATLSNKGKTILVVTHDASFEESFDRVVRLKDGKIIEADDEAEESTAYPHAQ